MKGCGQEIAGLPCCTIIRGDCEDYLSRFEPGSVDLIVTDPPYGRNCLTQRIAKGQHRQIHGDDHYPVETISALIKIPRLASYFFCQWQNLWEPSLPSLLPKPTSIIAWVKPAGGTGDCQHEHMRAHELILFYPQLPEHSFVKRPPDVISTDRTGNLKHPTQKPPELFMRIFSWYNFTTVLDPYAGSASTLQAARDMGKHFLGFEIDEGHHAEAVYSLEKPLVRRVRHADTQPRLEF